MVDGKLRGSLWERNWQFWHVSPDADDANQRQLMPKLLFSSQGLPLNFQPGTAVTDAKRTENFSSVLFTTLDCEPISLKGKLVPAAAARAAGS